MNNECMPGESIIDINLGMHMIRTEGGFTYGTDALLLAAFARGKSGGRSAAAQGRYLCCLPERENMSMLLPLRLSPNMLRLRAETPH